MEDMLNGMWRLSRGGYVNDERATMTLYGPGTVSFQRLYTEKGWDYLQFGGDLAPKLWGRDGSVPADIEVPEGPQEVVWYSDGSVAMSRPGLPAGWSFDFIPATTTTCTTTTTTSTTTSTLQLKLKLKVKGKSKMKAWLKVKVMNGETEAKDEVKVSHRRRRRRG